MTIQELIDRLEELKEDVGGDVEVRLAHQPQWPFEYSIGDVIAIEKDEAADADPDDDGYDESADQEETIVYIAESSQIGYLSGHATNELGWGRR